MFATIGNDKDLDWESLLTKKTKPHKSMYDALLQCGLMKDVPDDVIESIISFCMEIWWDLIANLQTVYPIDDGHNWRESQKGFSLYFDTTNDIIHHQNINDKLLDIFTKYVKNAEIYNKNEYVLRIFCNKKSIKTIEKWDNKLQGDGPFELLSIKTGRYWGCSVEIICQQIIQLKHVRKLKQNEIFYCMRVDTHGRKEPLSIKAIISCHQQ